MIRSRAPSAEAAGPAPAGTLLEAPAHAKVNLGLAVTGTRPDGYHTLCSVFLRVAQADHLALRVGGSAGADRLQVLGDAACPIDGNLVLRALGVLRAAWPGGEALTALEVILTKAIPMGAGLAGGSSDAATALRLAARAWGGAPATVDLPAEGARLGADVPFFLGDHAAARVGGVGELIDALPPLRSPVGVLLLTPPFAISTPAVFRALDDGATPDRDAALAVTTALATAWQDGLDGPRLAAYAPALRDANDLWPAAAVVGPGLPAIRDRAEAVLGVPVLLTGSGSTLVALYPSPGDAHAAADVLARPGALPDGCRVVATRDAPIPTPLDRTEVP